MACVLFLEKWIHLHVFYHWKTFPNSGGFLTEVSSHQWRKPQPFFFLHNFLGHHLVWYQKVPTSHIYSKWWQLCCLHFGMVKR